MENKWYLLAVAVVIVALAAYLAMRSAQSRAYDLSVALAPNGAYGTLYPYQSENFTLTVKNGGTSPVTTPVGFYVDGAQLSYGTYTIPAHGSISLYKNYTYKSYGTYLFNAKVDPAGVLNVADRNATSNTLAVGVTRPEIADVYTSIPNNGITYTVSFSMSGSGVYSMALLGGIYNIGYFNAVAGLDRNITSKALQDLYSYMASANGAYSDYANGTQSYIAWFGGTLTPKDINTVISSFGKNETSSENGTISYFRLTNTTSLCDEYVGGWTKMLEYSNASENLTCMGIMSSGHNDTLSTELINAIKASNTLTTLQSRFMYTNSTPLGNLLEYDGRNLSVSSVFQLSTPPGLFISRIAKLSKPEQFATESCRGLVYTNNNINVCSSVMLTANGTAPSSYDLIDSKMLTQNYSFDLFSFINSTYLVAAHANGARLIQSLGIAARSSQWKSTFSNACEFNSTVVGCNVSRFDYVNNTAYLNITDLTNTPLTINRMSCALLSGGSNAISPGMTVEPNAAATVKVPCIYIPISGVAAVTQYGLKINYTIANAISVVNGTLNVTNVVS